MKYRDLKDEDKKKYGPALFEIIETRKAKGFKSFINIDDYILVKTSSGTPYWIMWKDED